MRINKDVQASLDPASDIGPGAGLVVGGGVGVGGLRGGNMAVWGSVVVGLGVLFIL